MVIVSPTLFGRTRGPDRFWKRRRILSLSAHFYGRKQNCYSVAIKVVQRALRFGTRARTLKKRDMRMLWETRLDASCQEFGVSYQQMRGIMNDIGVQLDRKALQNLAIFEPRTFRSMAMLAKAKDYEKGLNSLEGGPPSGVITRGML